VFELFFFQFLNPVDVILGSPILLVMKLFDKVSENSREMELL
jgi:hypothetical protein